MENRTSTTVGLWIDHREAIIVSITNGVEKFHSIESGIEKHVRFSGGKPDDQVDHKFTNHLNEYYDTVKTYLREADAILIFGPGEAKVELSVRLKGETLGERIEGIETTDKMTQHQIAAKVREHFLNSTKEILQK